LRIIADGDNFGNLPSVRVREEIGTDGLKASSQGRRSSGSRAAANNQNPFSCGVHEFEKNVVRAVQLPRVN
jgi:hypothetical protein